MFQIVRVELGREGQVVARPQLSLRDRGGDAHKPGVIKRTVARLLAAGSSRVLVDVASLKALLADQPTNADAPVVERLRSSRGRFTHVRRKANRAGLCDRLPGRPEGSETGRMGPDSEVAALS
jgi:hypothetical protein